MWVTNPLLSPVLLIFPLLSVCNILSSPSSLLHRSLKMLSGVSFNKVNLGSWKPPSQGHFSVTLRWILLSMKRGNIRSPGSHKRALSFFVSCCFQMQLEHITMLIVPGILWKQYTRLDLANRVMRYSTFGPNFHEL